MGKGRMERARHEAFLVVKASPDDLGNRPVTAPFASPEITVGSEGKAQVRVWNLGSRDLEGIVTEFYSVPAGLPVSPANAELIGRGNPAIIPSGQSVVIGCNQVWRRASYADLLLVMAYHAERDPLQAPFEVLRDRHVGQMNYPWAGVYEGRLGPEGRLVRVAVKASNQGFFRLQLFEEVGGRLSSFPRTDRVMKPNQHTFRWLEVEGEQKVLFDLILLDNNRLELRIEPRHPAGSNPLGREIGVLERLSSP